MNNLDKISKDFIKYQADRILYDLALDNKVDYSTYSELYDFMMEALDKMYDLGKLNGTNQVPIV